MMQNSHVYEQWTEAELNNRILQLYEKIEEKTLQNLQIAQKNCELEIQIKTIDDILETCQTRESFGTASINRSQESIEYKYEHLLHDHQKLARRVNQIEELLQHNKDPISMVRTLKSSRFKTASTQLLSKTHRKISTSKKQLKIDSFWNANKPDQTTRKIKIK